jgi:hypothetical protein
MVDSSDNNDAPMSTQMIRPDRQPLLVAQCCRDVFNESICLGQGGHLPNNGLVHGRQEHSQHEPAKEMLHQKMFFFI